MPLTDTKIKAIKPAEKPRKYGDGRGMYLEVAPSGGRWWRLKYRIAGKEKRLSLGVYPDVSLAKARELREEARKLIALGTDPSEVRKEAKQAKVAAVANRFEVVTQEWLASEAPHWAASHGVKVQQRLERDVLPSSSMITRRATCRFPRCSSTRARASAPSGRSVLSCACWRRPTCRCWSA